MSAQRYVADASGVARRIKYRYRCDAGGVVRQIKRRYVADASGVPRLTYILGDILVLVAGSTPPDNNGDIAYGYDGIKGAPIGSLTPTTLGDGASVYLVESNQKVDVAANTPGYYSFALNAPAGMFNVSNPVPQSYLTELIISGPGIGTQSFLGANATFVRASAIQAGWGWGPGLPPFTAGATYEVVVLRSDQ